MLMFAIARRRMHGRQHVALEQTRPRHLAGDSAHFYREASIHASCSYASKTACLCRQASFLLERADGDNAGQGQAKGARARATLEGEMSQADKDTEAPARDRSV